MIKNILILIRLLQKVILHMRISYVALLQISKLKHVNFTILIQIVLLTLRRDIMKMKSHYIIENVTLTLHALMNTS